MRRRRQHTHRNFELGYRFGDVLLARELIAHVIVAHLFISRVLITHIFGTGVHFGHRCRDL
jgi:hypothetical protein